MSLRGDRSIVPMVMFHSVGLESYPWVYAHLSEPLKLFETRLEMLNRRGFRSVFWGELYEHMAGRRQLPPDCIVLTFDDGYLDNWVYVFPLLKKYGVKATIFVNPEFVDPVDRLRANLEDKSDIPAERAAGFLSWPELRAMQSSGLVDIQSHAMNHTWYYSGPKIIDFHHPGDRYPWLAWNAKPERKPYYMVENQDGFVPEGWPVLFHEKSLVCRKFSPEQEAMARIAEFVRTSAELWQQDGGRVKAIDEVRNAIGSDQVPGTMESEKEYRSRVQWELSESRKRISEELSKPVDFICWPGGGYNETVLQLAREVGYKAWTLGSRDQSSRRNRPGSEPEQVKRLGSQSRWCVRGRDLGAMSSSHFYYQLRAHQRSPVSVATLKARNLFGYAMKRVGLLS